MNALDDLALKYGSDKTPTLKHHYTQFYFDWFNERRLEVRKVLEIGIGYPEVMVGKDYQIGASLKMWQDFFPNAMVYGADINRDTLISEARIQTFYCNQSDRLQLADLLSKTGTDLDLVIDDGSHIKHDQIITARFLVPLLAPGATYIIEDARWVGTLLRELADFGPQVFEAEGRIHHDDRLVRILA